MFIIIGLATVAVIALWAGFQSGFRGARATVAIVVSLVVVLLIAWFGLTRSTELGDPSPGLASPYREIVLFVIMLAGMAARFLTRAIETRRERIAAARTAGGGAAIGIEFDVWEFVYPMITSVMTFGLLLQQIGDGALSVATVVLAFQNGFFWQTLLGQIESRMAAKPA
jgi:hypothetical protein